MSSDSLLIMGTHKLFSDTSTLLSVSILEEIISREGEEGSTLAGSEVLRLPKILPATFQILFITEEDCLSSQISPILKFSELFPVGKLDTKFNFQKMPIWCSQ